MLVCKNCGRTQDELTAKIEKHYLPNGGYHLKALCHDCGVFIQNMPHSLPQILHFGKYKGKPIAVIAKENTSYLRWLCSKDIKNNLRQAILIELKKVDDDSLQGSLKLS